jgi:methionyl-tRNA formyltransferase
MLIQENMQIKGAPKIFKNDCRINWNDQGLKIYNLIRGMSPFPCAWTELYRPGDEKPQNLKIYECEWISEFHQKQNGSIIVTKNDMLVAVHEGYIKIKSLQIEGKKRLKAEEFLNGFKFDQHFLR